jgi:hypothetical protein
MERTMIVIVVNVDLLSGVSPGPVLPFPGAVLVGALRGCA